MKNHKPRHSATPSRIPVRTLDPQTLETVGGGHSIVSPRDPQSGLPTGQEI